MGLLCNVVCVLLEASEVTNDHGISLGNYHDKEYEYDRKIPSHIAMYQHVCSVIV